MKLVIKNKMCLNCLNTNHQVNDCRSKNICRTCKAKHHSSLHGAKLLTVVSGLTTSTTTINSQSPSSLLSANTVVEPVEICVLKTAIMSVVTQKGVITANAIIDEGSQRTLITIKLAKGLKIKNSSQEYLLLSGSTGLSCGG